MTRIIATLVALLAIATPGLTAGAPVADDPRALEDRAADSARQEKLNVLVVLTDDQRPDSLAVMPAVDRWLTRQGTSFPRTLVSSPSCCPSRVSIFTGRYPHNHGVLTAEGDRLGRLDHSTTLHSYLGEQGYRTAIFGKYLNGWKIGDPPPQFDRWAVYRTNYPARVYYGNDWNINGELRTVDAYSTTFLADRAARFIERQADEPEPWLLYVSTAAPHSPFTPAPKYEEAEVPAFRYTPATLEEDLSDKPAYVQLTAKPIERARQERRKQLRTLMSVDDLVGNLLRTLGRTDQRSETIVVFTSDNGYLWREHGLVGKAAPYLPSLQVPLVVRGPGIARGATDPRWASNVDIAPTILHALGLEQHPDVPMDGRSLLDESWERDRMFFEFNARGKNKTPNWAGLMWADRYYIEYYGREDEPIPAPTDPEYYDLLADPWMLINLIGDGDPTNNPATADEAAQLARDRACIGTTGPRACP